MQPGPQGQLVMHETPGFALQPRIGDEAGDLAGITGVAGVERNMDGELFVEKGVAVEIGGAIGRQMQVLGGAELQVVFEQVIEAFVALQFDGDQCRLTLNERNSATDSSECSGLNKHNLR